ncbi:hypothetical protein EIP91_001478 [Steccherinum ochraceum]|uniref:Protein NO VEIN C-terminal domain-containing protein n=1 Tax=Steccherinum ochraceum TaxID=92696 RepID=A0A4R0RMC7_9APHY|nr:hypothetical protein EIP91_001478 [Steccherinum ochraceum]
MDLIESIRRELGFIQVRGQPAVESAIRELGGNLGRALNSLSNELYSKATHFLLEFIQNADDNVYPSQAVPTLRITLEPGWLVIECNEVGFTAENVKALCKIGASTKKGQEGYIGEKGIGFKAVFKIADVVYVLSRDFTFYFNRDSELGMITPIWTRDHQVRKGWTTFRLKLSDSNVRHMKTHLSQIQPSLLLFLRRLRQVEVVVAGRRRTFFREASQSDKDIVLKAVEGSQVEFHRFLVLKHQVSTYTDDAKRFGISTSQLVLAFPLTMDEKPVIMDQAVYAFLPLRNFGFKFLIQGDFLTPSSREDILCDLRWNITIRDAIPQAFIQAIEEFKSRPSLQFEWFRFIPDGVSDSFMRPVQDALIEQLQSQPVILCDDGEYRAPAEVIMEPYSDDDDVPLIPPNFLSGRHYLSTQYDLTVHQSTLETLGVKSMTEEDLLKGLAEMYYDTSFLESRTEAWHESVCECLMDILTEDESTRWQMKSLRIVPLTDNSWSTSWLSHLHFNPSSADIPLDLGVYFVRPLPPQSFRYKLFQSLGITEADPRGIAGRILEIHSKADAHIQRTSLLAHVRYLFDHRLDLEAILSVDLELWVGATGDTVVRSTELYMNHPRYPSEFSLSQFFNAPFIAVEYMTLYPMDSRDFKQWSNWLQDKLGIQTTPRVIDGGLSSEFSSILKTVETAKLLRFLRVYWGDVRERVLNSPDALAELRSTTVTCTNGTTERLEATFLATSKLAKFNDLLFLPIVDPDDPSWEFLEHLGVSLKLDGMYSLKRLIRLSETPHAKRSDVTDLYKQLEARFDEGDNTKAIRDAFKQHKLILGVWNKPNKPKEWLGLTDVVWVAPRSVQSKCQLDAQFPHLKKFFISLGVPADCPPDILLDEIKPIAAEWKGKLITDEVFQRVSDILIDIDRVLFHASRRSKPVDLGWLYALRSEAIFPVRSPSVGLTLLSINDTFYLPDRSGSLAQLFTDTVPIIANPQWMGKPGKSLLSISYLLNHEEFKPKLRSLDQVVKSKTTTQGQRVRDKLLSEQYTKRVQLIRKMLLYNAGGRSSRVYLRAMNVFQVESVETTFSVGSATRSIPDELALELVQTAHGGELGMIIGRNCTASRRDLTLSRKIADLLHLETAAVHLALTTPLDSVEATFRHLNIVPVAEYEEEEEFYRQNGDGAESLPFSFDRKAASPDFKDVFGSAEPQLRAAGFRTTLSHTQKFQLNYKFGSLAMSETRELTFSAAASAAPNSTIVIPSIPNYPQPSPENNHFQPSDDSTVLETFGEFYVFQVLKSNLPKFGVDNWTSKHRVRSGFKPLTDTARAAFVYPDVQGKMTDILYGSETRQKWSAQWPTYYFDVKTTEGAMTESFRMTKDEFSLAADLTIRNPNEIPAEIYALVRVADINQSTRSFKMFPDPHRLIYDRKITMASYSTTMSITLKASSENAKHSIAKVTEIAVALRSGKLPSQDQLNHILRQLLQSALSSEENEGQSTHGTARLSDRSRTLVEAARETVDAVMQIGLEKNYDDKLQDLVHLCSQIDSQSVHADVAIDVGEDVDVQRAAENLPTTDEVSDDASKLLNALRSLTRLLLTSSAFRLIVSDIFASAREVFADAAAEVRHVAERVQGVVQTMEEVARPMDVDAVRERALEVAQGVSDEAEVAEEEVKRRLDEMNEEAPDRIREIVTARIQQAIIQAHQNPAYRDALQTIMDLFQKYIFKISAAVEGIQSVERDGSRVLPTFTPIVWTDDEDLSLALSHLRVLLARFASGHAVDDVLDSLYAVVWDVVNVPAEADQENITEVKTYFSSLALWFNQALQDPSYSTSAEGTAQINALFDQARSFVHDALNADPATAPVWVRDVQHLVHEVQAFMSKFGSDKSSQRLLAALDNLSTATSLFMQAFTADIPTLSRQASLQIQKTKRQVRNDLLSWLLPRLLRAIRVVPMPRVEYKDSLVEAAIDALLLTSSSLGTSLVPDHIRVQTFNDVELDFTPPPGHSGYTSLLDALPGLGPLQPHQHTQVRSCTRIKIHADGIRLSAEDIGYYVRFMGSLGLGYEDEGLLSVDVGSQGSAETTSCAEGGVSLDVDLVTETTDSSLSNASSTSTSSPLFTVQDVHVTVPHLHFSLNHTRHPIMSAFIQPLSGPIARTAVGYYLRRQIWEGLELVGRLAGEVLAERAILDEEEDQSSGLGWEAYLTAALNVLGRERDTEGSEDEARAGIRSGAPSPPETHTYPTTQGIVRTTRTRVEEPSSSSQNPDDGVEESTLAIGIGPQILPGKGEPHNLENGETGLRDVAREALEEVQGAVDVVVDEVRRDVRGAEDSAVEAGRRGRERLRREEGREGWQSDAFDW